MQLSLTRYVRTPSLRDFFASHSAGHRTDGVQQSQKWAILTWSVTQPLPFMIRLESPILARRCQKELSCWCNKQHESATTLVAIFVRWLTELTAARNVACQAFYFVCLTAIRSSPYRSCAFLKREPRLYLCRLSLRKWEMWMQESSTIDSHGLDL